MGGNKLFFYMYFFLVLIPLFGCLKQNSEVLLVRKFEEKIPHAYQFVRHESCLPNLPALCSSPQTVNRPSTRTMGYGNTRHQIDEDR